MFHAVRAGSMLAGRPGVVATALVARRRAQPAVTKTGAFPLTVDSIMRGPDLVGYPPDGLRWSADSTKLYFEWRRPGQDEATTYVVGRDGGAPVELTDEQKKTAPPVERPLGQGPQARRLRRSRRRRAARPAASAARSREPPAPRAIPDGRATIRRSPSCSDGNLFIVPLTLEPAAIVQQLTDVAPKKAEPRLTDSQKFIRDEEDEADRGGAGAEGQEEEDGRRGGAKTSCPPSSCRTVSPRSI